MLFPDLKAKKPLYKQIIKHFEERIMNGDIPPHTLLPTERELAFQLNVNRSTVHTAYEELRAAGLIHSVQGSGTRVCEYLWDVEPQKILNWNNFTSFTFSPSKPMVKKIQQARLDKNIVNLANGELSFDLFPSDFINNILCQLSSQNEIDYSGEMNDHPFKVTLSEHLHEQQVAADPDHMVVISNIHQAFLLITHCLLNPGDAVAVECPSYAYTVKLFSSAGVKMIRLPVHHDGIDPEDVVKLYEKNKIKMIITEPTYQNPTGTVLDLEKRKRLIDICTELEILIVELDCSRGLTHDQNTELPPSLYSLDHKKQFVIHIGSFIDTIAPDVPLTWILASSGFIEKFQDAKYQMGIGTPGLYLQVVSKLIQNGWRDNLSKINKVMIGRKQRMIECIDFFLKDLFSYHYPTGGLYLWGNLNYPIRDNDLLEACLKENVLITPGTIYGSAHGSIRLAFSKASEEEIETGIQRLANVVKNTRSIYHLVQK